MLKLPFTGVLSNLFVIPWVFGWLIHTITSGFSIKLIEIIQICWNLQHIYRSFKFLLINWSEQIHIKNILKMYFLGLLSILTGEPSVFNNCCRYTAVLTALPSWKWRQDADSKPINQIQIQKYTVKIYRSSCSIQSRDENKFKYANTWSSYFKCQLGGRP